MDASTTQRGRAEEKPRRPATPPEQPARPEHPQTGEQKSGEPSGSSANKPKASLRAQLREHWMLSVAGAGVLLIAAIGGLLYWLSVRDYEWTDDAFIAARSFSIAPKVSGYVTDVPVTDNQHVGTGELIARIDQRDYRIAVDQAKAQVAIAQANIDNIQAQIDSQQEQIKQAQAQLDQAEAQLKFAQQEEARAKDLVDKGAGTVQREQQTRSDLQSQQANEARARAGLIAAQLGIKTLKAQLESAQGSLQQAQAQQGQAELNLQYTDVVAAQPGRVVKLSGAVGTFAAAGQSLAMFVPDEIWVVANYKETQLVDMRPGQRVEFAVDAYPDRKLVGHVESVQPGSGTAFSLLPAENATGNFVKVVQRVPVKIVADQWPVDLPIGPGMSVIPWTKVR
ncbi:MAG TPA: HlyD family secretion protein [Bradyrhizobium sp.]|nr:HlyD family secretion protein [Bradyrhizobium sp.]HET7888670.1 HlyD family secretion protein [Bradyrhizobium sp.]